MKNIAITEASIEQACAILRKQLAGQLVTGNDITVKVPTKYAITEDQKPTIIVTPVAEHKMRALTQQAIDEVAWHGSVVYDEETNTYTIEDIFVFPQDVTGATATATDDYGTWLFSLPEDTFNKIRFHGHSHVNMGVFPSGTDISYQETLLSMIDDFYIFAIYNKKDDYNIWIYDKANNWMYEKEDIYYDSEISEVAVWAHNEMQAKVKRKSYAAAAKPAGWIPTFQDGYAWDVKSQGYLPKVVDEKKNNSHREIDQSKNKPGRKPGGHNRRSTYEDINKELKPELYNGSSSKKKLSEQDEIAVQEFWENYYNNVYGR